MVTNPNLTDELSVRFQAAFQYIEYSIRTAAKVARASQDSIQEYLAGTLVPPQSLVEEFERRAREKKEILAELGLKN